MDSVDIKMISSINLDIVIVGAGASGVGIGILLRKMQLESFCILEKNSVGESFSRWPLEMQMISPSFTGNFFGMPDLNAVTPETSPAYSFQTEHPTGKQYAIYLKDIADYYGLPVVRNVKVESLKKEGGGYLVKTQNDTLIKAKFVIWAAGEFQYPNDNPFSGADNCIHNSKVKSWSDFKDEKYFVIGAYESGIDAAYQLAKNGKKVVVIDANDPLSNIQSDSSYSLSPFTRDRYLSQKDNIEIIPNMRVTKIESNDNLYIITTENGEKFTSFTKPFLATGFKTSLNIVDEFFDFEDGVIQLTDNDESTKSKGIFLVGPQVRHGKVIFCFIYKFRQRFAVVAQEIVKRLGENEMTKEILDEYKLNNFYLEDLSCCEDECTC